MNLNKTLFFSSQDTDAALNLQRFERGEVYHRKLVIQNYPLQE